MNNYLRETYAFNVAKFIWRNKCPRAEVGHDIEPGVSSWFDNYTVHALSCGTDPHKMFRLDVSSAAQGFYYTNIGEGREWRGTDMYGPGGGQPSKSSQGIFTVST